MSERLPTVPAPNGPTPPLPSQAVGFGAQPPIEDDAPTLRSYLGAIRRHAVAVLASGLLGLGLFAFVTLRAERVYSSRAVVQFPEQAGGGGGGGLAGLAASLGGSSGSIATQMQVIRSRLLLGEVVDSLGLRLQREVAGAIYSKYRPSGYVTAVRIDSAATAGRLDLTFGEDRVEVVADGSRATAPYGGQIDIGGIHFIVPSRPPLAMLTLLVGTRDQAIDALIAETATFQREGTNVVDVVATGYDSEIPQRLANEVTRVYKEFTSSLAREQAQKQREFLQTQLSTAESLLRETQDRLTDFRKSQGLYSSKAKAAAEQAGGMELEMKRAELDAERRVYRSMLNRVLQSTGRESENALRTLVSLPVVAKNPMIASLYDQVNQLQARRDSIVGGTLGRSPTDPDVRRMDASVASAQARLIAAVRSGMESLDAQVSALDMIKARSDSAMIQLAGTEPEEVRLVLQMETVGEAVKELRSRFYTAGTAEAATADQVVILDPALQGQLAGSGPMRSILLGLIFGLMVGGAGAVAYDSANRSIRRREQLERTLRVRDLAFIPPIGGEAKRSSLLRRSGSDGRRARPALGEGALVAKLAVHSPGAEAYRSLRTSLSFAGSGGRLRSLVVTSPSAQEGKTTTAANLAVTYAQQGLRVLLVDADLRRPGLHSIFHLPVQPGLAELLLGDVAVEEAIRTTDVANLSLLPAGVLSRVAATDLVSGGVLRSVLDAVTDEYDVILLDAPPVLAGAHTAILATSVDGVILVVRAGQTELDAAQNALRQLSSVGARVVGAVLNDPDAEVRRTPNAYDELPART